MKARAPRFLLLILAVFGGATMVAQAQPVLNITSPGTGTIPGNYTTSKVFVDEIAGDSVPITIDFAPNEANLTAVEVLTNLNRRDRANQDANGDGIEDGIVPPNTTNLVAGDDTQYYKAYTMTDQGGGNFRLVLNATKTGAYRLTARWKVAGDPNWRWYSNLQANRRDHAIVVSPKSARDISMYEVNVLNMEAEGTQFAQRSTFQDLTDRPGRLRTDRWNLDFVKNLGINWLWFQPYHPYGWEGRHLSAANINARAPGSGADTLRWINNTWVSDVNYPYQLGSPYAVKNFFEIEPRMTADFLGNPGSYDDVRHPDNRARAMTAFLNFVADADAQGVNLMPDAAFNHTAWDVEVGPVGLATLMPAAGGSGWSASDLIHDRELRFFSRAADYAQRASFYVDFFNNNIAPAPDRGDFGKWLDATDVFFGRYAALVNQNPQDNGNFNSEADWFNYDPITGNFDAVTRSVWKYFGEYARYWLEKSRAPGTNRNSESEPGLTTAQRYAWDNRGIDGLRCDFGQGLPPQAWEYIINVARSYKWNFVMMAESLDGGAVTYRSNRHFDILNENIVFAAKNTTTTTGFRGMFEDRRAAYGQGLILLNTVSHDEDNYVDPWRALINYAVFSTIDGAPMLFPGQELGISQYYGYDLIEMNFGKPVPHFKTYNSLMPLWSDTDFGNDQLYPVYAGIGAARRFSPALRSSNRWFLNRKADGQPNQNIWAVAKYETPNGSPGSSDVVFAFVNLGRSFDVADTFDVNHNANGSNIYGIKADRRYNVKNIAAYTAQDSGRRSYWLWGASGRTGTDVLNNGIFVSLPQVPGSAQFWASHPFEAQYLKLYDVTPPANSGVPAPALTSQTYSYVLGNTVVFNWAASPTVEGVVPQYRIRIGTTPGGSEVLADTVVSGTSYTLNRSAAGEQLFISVTAVNPSDNTQTSQTVQQSVVFTQLSTTADSDGDGLSNAAEHLAGTNPLSASSALRVRNVARDGGSATITWDSVAGKTYKVQARTDMNAAWTDLSGNITTPGSTGSHTDNNPGEKKFYRVVLVAES